MNKIPKTPRPLKHLNHKKQNGIFLLMFASVLLTAILLLFLSRSNEVRTSVLNTKTQNEEHDIQILAQAKTALIGYATSYAETKGAAPSYIPCPNLRDLNTSVGIKYAGTTDAPCGAKGKNTVGCLPWRELGLPRLKDSLGNDLWYMVSGNYKSSYKSAITPDTTGQLKISTIESGVIAVIIAPGDLAKTANIEINCADVITLLTGGNILTKTSDTDWTINQHYLNEKKYKSVWINQTDYMPVYEYANKWVADKVRRCLEKYANHVALPPSVINNKKKYPWLAKVQKNSAQTDLDYKGIANQRFGHIPQDLSATKSTDNLMNISWEEDDDCSSSSCLCFEENISFSNSTIGNWVGWWIKWKEFVFVAINRQYAPDSADINDNSLNSGLNVDGVPTKFVVIVSGKKLSDLPIPTASDHYNQQRDTLDAKLAFKNYLENTNLVTMQSMSPESVVTGKVTDKFNDAICSDQLCK